MRPAEFVGAVFGCTVLVLLSCAFAYGVVQAFSLEVCRPVAGTIR